MTSATHMAYKPTTGEDGFHISAATNVMTSTHFVAVYCAPGSGPNHTVEASITHTIIINAYSYMEDKG